MIKFIAAWYKASKNKPAGATHWNYRNGEYWKEVFHKGFLNSYTEWHVWAKMENIGWQWCHIQGDKRSFWLPV